MALKQQHLELKNILQDTVMKIPFFISSTETNILAIQFEHNIMHYLQQNSAVQNLQLRLYFHE